MGGKFSVDEEECGFEEGGVLCELLDGDASVFEDALVTIDVANLRGIADGVHVSGIVHSDGLSLVVLELADIFGINEVGVLALLDLDFNGLAGPVVGE